jgi:ferritin-like metal-binding protein YciE
METPNEVIVRYLQDCEAAERNFESALGTFAVTGEQNEVKRMFEMATQRARSQHQRLEARLKELGAERSTLKSILAHVLAFAPTTAQIGHEPAEKNTQHLMVCIAAASAEMAMYESLATAARLAGDSKTERLARELQAEEKDDYDKSWNLLRPSAVASFQTVIQRQGPLSVTP